MNKSVSITYFAVLRECTGKQKEVRETSGQTYQDLYNELKEEYHFPIEASQVRVAIGESYSEMSAIIEEKAEIVFIPPVAGG